MSQIGATANVEYLGKRTQDEVNRLLARAHLLVNTSIHEGFPNTFIQAWMRNVPVVSLNVDPDDVLERESLGKRATCEQELVETVRMFITNAALRTECAARARSYALQRHSLRNAEVLAQILESGEVNGVHAEVKMAASLPRGDE